MSVVFKDKPGQIFDFYQCIDLAYNRSADEILNEYRLDWDKDARKAYEFLLKNIDTTNSELDLFFHKEVKAFSMFLDLKRFWECESIEGFIESLRGYTEDDLRLKLMKILNVDPKVDDNNLKAISSDKNKLMHFLDKTGKPPATKWSALNFIYEPKAYMNKVIAFLEDFAAKYYKVLNKNASAINEFNQFLIDKINTMGKEFFINEFQNFASIEKYKIIHVSSACIGNYSIEIENDDISGTMYIFLGKDYKRIMNYISKNNEEESVINVLRIISDPTRYQIVKLLQEKAYYGQEIAEKVNLSMATISHHMEALNLVAKIVKADNSGHRVYYSLNKEELKRCLNYLISGFEL